jgi:hypothetical protein
MDLFRVRFLVLHTLMVRSAATPRVSNHVGVATVTKRLRS